MSFARHPSLEGCVVFVTGGATGIGAAMVRAFSEQGAKVAFVDVLEAEARALVGALSGSAHPPRFDRCDVTDGAALRAVIADIGENWGPIGVLVNNAARDDRHEIDDVTEDYWDDAMAVNLRHQFFAAQAVRAQMRQRGGGSIINFSSVVWKAGGAKLAAYATAKAGIVGLTNSLANEFGRDDIRVNAIAPGAVVTDRQLRLWYSEEEADALAARQCIKRRLLPEDVARAALFLASDDSSMITKQCLQVDAGIR